MADTKNYIVQPQDGGSILISEDVIASIAALAVREVEGVYGLSAPATVDISSRLGKQHLRRGLRVTMEEERVESSVCGIAIPKTSK